MIIQFDEFEIEIRAKSGNRSFTDVLAQILSMPQVIAALDGLVSVAEDYAAQVGEQTESETKDTEAAQSDSEEVIQ